MISVGHVSSHLRCEQHVEAMSGKPDISARMSDVVLDLS
jgi:hypothetical protein